MTTNHTTTRRTAPETQYAVGRPWVADGKNRDTRMSPPRDQRKIPNAKHEEHQMKTRHPIRMTALALAIAGATAHAQENRLYETHLLPDSLLIEPVDELAMGTKIDLILRGPEGFYQRQSFDAGELVEFDPSTVTSEAMPDGIYNYEMRIMDIQGVKSNRETGEIHSVEPGLQNMSGAFSIKNGQIVSPEVEEEPAAKFAQGVTSAGAAKAPPRQGTQDQVINDDLIVGFSACIGNDCVNGETFGFDTLRLKENNLRIKFQDTSTAGSFPTNDWELTANDSANGGANRFSIRDVDAGRDIFTVEAGAGSNSLYVDNGGRVGFGTSNPVVESHIVDGDSPTVRLEQDGSSGFTPQTWDMAGNETNFFVRDVTNGSRLPFKIRPGAATDSLVIDAEGQVAMGIANANAPLHVRETANLSNLDAHILVENTNSTVGVRRGIQLKNNGGVSAVFENVNSGVSWAMVNANTGTSFLINDPNSPNREFELDQSGNVTIEGELITAGTCSVGCDRVFDPGYAVPSIDAQVEQMYANRYLPNVGPTPENHPINISQKITGILNELEKAHIYIGQLHARIEELEARSKD